MHVFNVSVHKPKTKKENIMDGIRFYLQSDLGTVFCRLFKTGITAKNTFNVVEWNILLVLYFRFERHFLFFLLKHKKENRGMGKEQRWSVNKRRNTKGCEVFFNGRHFIFTLWQFPLSGRYAVTSSLLTFWFFLKYKYRLRPGGHLGRPHWLPLFGQTSNRKLWLRILLLKQH